MVTEITWDSIVKRTTLSGPALDIFSNFFRAALLEEFFKFRGFIHAKRKYQLSRKIDFILTAGMMGLVYGLFEKIVLGNIGAVIIGLICPMHILWQFNQGGHYYEYEKNFYVSARSCCCFEHVGPGRQAVTITSCGRQVVG